MRHHNDGQRPFHAEARNQFQHLRPLRRTKRGEGFVEQKDGPVAQKRAGDGDALALTAGEFGGAAGAKPLQPDLRQRHGDPRAVIRCQTQVRVDPKADIRRRVEMGEKVVFLK